MQGDRKVVAREIEPQPAAPRLNSQERRATFGRGRVHLHRHIDARAEAVDNRHETIGGKPSQISMTDAREIRRRCAGAPRRLAHTQTLTIECFDNLRGQERFESFDIGVFLAEIPEYVSAPAAHFKLFFHHNISANRFSLSWIRSISRCGVLIPRAALIHEIGRVLLATCSSWRENLTAICCQI